MQHPRLLLASVSVGLLAAVLPVLAATGDVASIGLKDFDHDGKIDRAVVTFANPSKTAWSVHGTTGLVVTYNNTPLIVSDAFMSSTSDPAVLEIVLDETDAHLPATTAAAGFEVSYHRVGASIGVGDGSTELAAITAGDTNAADTELDQAAPILVSSDPAAGSSKITRTKDLTLVFSEPVDQTSLVTSSALNPGGWGVTSPSDSPIVVLQHSPYPYDRTETFGVTVKDASGNILVREGYPNPFVFRTSSTTDSVNAEPQIDGIFALTSPVSLDALMAGEANVLAWYSNQPEITDVRLSYSSDDGQNYTTIGTVPVAQRTYVWYPMRITGAIRLKAEGLASNGSFVNISTVGSLTMTGDANPPPLRAISSIDVTNPTETSAKIVVRLDRTPSAASFSCNGGTVTSPVLISGDRPARLEANITGLTAGSSYACSFHITDVAPPALDLTVPSFAAGFDTTAPQIAGVAVIDHFDAAAGTARLTWTTDEASTATVSYGPYLNYVGASADTNLSTTHSVTLSGLTPGQMHQARITSIDAKGNAGVSKDYYFVFLRSGDLIKGSASAVYWYENGKRHAFPNETVYRSWFGADFSKVILVGDTQIGTIPLDFNITMKEGVYLVKIQSDPKTYAVTPNGGLRWIQSEAQASALYGTAWAKRVRDIDVSLWVDYTIGDPLADDEKPAGYIN